MTDISTSYKILMNMYKSNYIFAMLSGVRVAGLIGNDLLILAPLLAS